LGYCPSIQDIERDPLDGFYHMGSGGCSFCNLDAAEIEHPDLGKKIFLLFVLLTWGGLSAYQYRGRIKIDYKVKNSGLNIGLAPLQSGLTKVVLSSIVTFISLVSAVLGIVGFYLDHLR
jgi:hypothetical protein